ncbi:MAG TPA: pitrilysin family protein [Stellaceae bacterium]|nr:pitrilysin family protein [Stellaceae bacterium]
MNARHTFILAAALVAWCGGAGAVTIEAVESPRGVKAWLVEDHSLAVVTIDASFTGGAVLDPAAKAGLANLACDLMDEGAGELDSSAYQGKLEDLATSLQFGAGEDAIGVTLRSVTQNLRDSAALLHLALTQPRFDAAAVARVKSQLLASLARDEHQPRAIADRYWREAMFADHPYARRLRGTPETIAAVGVDDLRGLVRDRFAKDVLLIGVVGDITPDQLKPLLDQTFGDLPDHAAAASPPPLKMRTEGEMLLARLAIPQSVVVFGEPGIKRDDPDWFAAFIDNDILGGGGFSSRLTEEVREKRGLAYSVYSALQPMEEGGVIAGGVGTENARVAESIALIRSEWQRMRDDGPTAQELAAAKTYLTGSFPLNLDSTGRIAGTLVQLMRDKLGIDYLDRRSGLIDAVTLDDAKRVAKRLFDPAALTFVVVGAPADLAGAREVGAGGG